MAKSFQLKYDTELKLYNYKPILMSGKLFLTMYWIEEYMYMGIDKKRASDLPKAGVIGDHPAMGDGNQIWTFCRDKHYVFLNIKPFL